MKLMSFGKDQKIGIKKIDNQHKEIINSINHLYRIKDSAKDEILISFDKLIDQLKIHFDVEENIMKENKVIHFISHKLEHDRALAKYQNFYNNVKSGNEEFDPAIIISLKNWLEAHLQKKDKKLQVLASNN